MTVVDKPRKVMSSMRLDEDVLAWLRSSGPGWQTQLNARFRAEMEGRLVLQSNLPLETLREAINQSRTIIEEYDD